MGYGNVIDLKKRRWGGGIMKKVWKKPKLVGLYRGRPDEAVLTCCKNNTVVCDPADDASVHYGCQYPDNCNCCDVPTQTWDVFWHSSWRLVPSRDNGRFFLDLPFYSSFRLWKKGMWPASTEYVRFSRGETLAAHVVKVRDPMWVWVAWDKYEPCLRWRRALKIFTSKTPARRWNNEEGLEKTKTCGSISCRTSWYSTDCL
jgi:hypothetical protein